MSADTAGVRVSRALGAIEAVTDYLNALQGEPDPVEQRRGHVLVARQLRAAADILDDEGNLTE